MKVAASVSLLFCLSLTCCNLRQEPREQESRPEPKKLKLGLIRNELEAGCAGKKVRGKSKATLDEFLEKLPQQKMEELPRHAAGMTPDERIKKGQSGDWGLRDADVHHCGPNQDELRALFKAAFAIEAVCQGVVFEELTLQERAKTPVRDISGYAEIFYRGPAQWSYQVNYDGVFVGATVTNEHEVAEQVCRILKGMGGQIWTPEAVGGKRVE